MLRRMKERQYFAGWVVMRLGYGAKRQQWPFITGPRLFLWLSQRVPGR